MKKNKIAIGQCYEKDDHVYMVLGKSKRSRYKNKWVIQDTLFKNLKLYSAKELLSFRKSFDNFG